MQTKVPRKGQRNKGGNERDERKRLRLLILFACLLVLATLATGGTLAYNNFMQARTNRFSNGFTNHGVRLHDDYKIFTNRADNDKDIYVENYGDSFLLVRVRLDEFYELNKKVIVGGTGAILNDPRLNWVTFKGDIVTKDGRVIADAGIHDDNTDPRDGLADWEWVFGGQKYYLPTENIYDDDPNPDNAYSSGRLLPFVNAYPAPEEGIQQSDSGNMFFNPDYNPLLPDGPTNKPRITGNRMFYTKNSWLLKAHRDPQGSPIPCDPDCFDPRACDHRHCSHIVCGAGTCGHRSCDPATCNHRACNALFCNHSACALSNCATPDCDHSTCGYHPNAPFMPNSHIWAGQAFANGSGGRALSEYIEANGGLSAADIDVIFTNNVFPTYKGSDKHMPNKFNPMKPITWFYDYPTPSKLPFDPLPFYAKTVQQTLPSVVITMEDWVSTGYPSGEFWVFDPEDGWFYWAQLLPPGKATGLLLTAVNRLLPESMYTTYSYGINASLQSCTPDEANLFWTNPNTISEKAWDLLYSCDPSIPQLLPQP